MTALAAAVAGELGASSGQAFPITFATGTQLPGNQRSYPIPTGDGATIDHTGQVIVARLHQQVYAFNLACPHQNTALRWRQEEMRFQCPRHGSKYQPDGTFISGRATRNMDRFAVQRQGDAILVDLNRLYRSDEQAALWSAAVVSL
jgi:Rieske Fe-S protein